MFQAIIICDSISPEGHRLTTMKLRYPKFIHGEFMTHRVFSRNASSSRAIPVKKYLEEVRSDELRAAPVWWGKNQPGMQAAEELGDEERLAAQNEWWYAAQSAAHIAERLYNHGAHKQIVNRILDPFVHINVVVTATEYMNFFGLRLDKAAQPEMRALAEAMWRTYDDSTPKLLRPGEWHLPFIRADDDEEAEVMLSQLVPPGESRGLTSHDHALRVSVARCARVSYESHETGKRSTVEEDLKLYERLREQGHWSPFEHQATPDNVVDLKVASSWNPQRVVFEHDAQHGNFVGWRQYRKMLMGERVAPLPAEYNHPARGEDH